MVLKSFFERCLAQCRSDRAWPLTKGLLEVEEDQVDTTTASWMQGETFGSLEGVPGTQMGRAPCSF